jgi:hypothetical protein
VLDGLRQRDFWVALHAIGIIASIAFFVCARRFGMADRFRAANEGRSGGLPAYLAKKITPE